MEIKGKSVYISGAISGVPDYKRYFKDVEEWAFGQGASSVFNPAAAIPSNYPWETAMDICKQTLHYFAVNGVVLVIDNKYLAGSKGVKIEVEMAKRLFIPVMPIRFTSWVTNG